MADNLTNDEFVDGLLTPRQPEGDSFFFRRRSNRPNPTNRFEFGFYATIGGREYKIGFGARSASKDN